MSAIIKDKTGFIKIYTKGADNIIKQRLSSKSQLNLDT
jgi:magnesium-transporting ATPase (P-type)